ncbi:hypothetical protein DIS24_g2344 [Lasiodiplodia hormozganensis]|uniref:Glucose receptor Git3-like N-terminal domain-containing protein n=1 Tax=Lasiodiplodia hormozganensis TaxID=869390 RepID=A0AA40D4V4_9PEZI|nr:hypothetical protein DIS24_g2344 [Lasiodiplodia hormozganensis]
MEMSYGYDSAISVPTLIGSLLSCLATSCVLVSYLFLAPQQPSFRHALVFALALTEFINSLNNTVSGIYVLEHRHGIAPGVACQLNGFIGQLSVQATDFSILTITLITFFTVIKNSYISSASRLWKIATCVLVWIVPLITSSIAASSDAIQPVGGNWCWIPKDRTVLRYALGHGWRFGIIVATICMYICMYFYIQHHFSSSNAFVDPISTSPPGRYLATIEADLVKPRPAVMRRATEPKDLKMIAELDKAVSQRLTEHVETTQRSISAIVPAHMDDTTATTSIDMTSPKVDADASVARNSVLTIDIPRHSLELSFLSHSAPPTSTILSRRLREKPSQTLTIDTSITPSSPPPRELFDSPTSIRTHMQQQSFNRHAQVGREVRRMLLLNAYPVAWVVLWLPGIANRLVEAAAGSSPRWLRIMQSTTQYVGLANALTYGFNEHMRSRARRDGNEGYGWSWRRGMV